MASGWDIPLQGDLGVEHRVNPVNDKWAMKAVTITGRLPETNTPGSIPDPGQNQLVPLHVDTFASLDGPVEGPVPTGDFMLPPPAVVPFSSAPPQAPIPDDSSQPPPMENQASTAKADDEPSSSSPLMNGMASSTNSQYAIQQRPVEGIRQKGTHNEEFFARYVPNKPNSGLSAAALLTLIVVPVIVIALLIVLVYFLVWER